jgi:hypothetical protein
MKSKSMSTKEGVKNMSDDFGDFCVRAYRGNLTPFQPGVSGKQYLGPVSVSHVNNMDPFTLGFHFACKLCDWQCNGIWQSQNSMALNAISDRSIPR